MVEGAEMKQEPLFRKAELWRKARLCREAAQRALDVRMQLVWFAYSAALDEMAKEAKA
jgi:hypothetical protein